MRRIGEGSNGDERMMTCLALLSATARFSQEAGVSFSASSKSAQKKGTDSCSRPACAWAGQARLCEVRIVPKWAD